jgi:hypothetical protein
MLRLPIKDLYLSDEDKITQEKIILEYENLSDEEWKDYENTVLEKLNQLYIDNAPPKEANMDDSLSTKIANLFWVSELNKRKTATVFFDQLRNAYKNPKQAQSQDMSKIFRDIVETISARDYLARRMVSISFKIDGYTAKLDDILNIFHISRYHPLRPNPILRSALPICKDIAEKLTFVDYDKKDTFFTGYVLLVAYYLYADYGCHITPSDMEKIANHIKHVIYIMVPIDNDPSEYRMYCFSGQGGSDKKDQRYHTVILTSQFFKDKL